MTAPASAAVEGGAADHGGPHGTRSVIAALLANLGIALGKLVGFALTRSSAMLAEAVHSLADAGNQGLLLLGVRRARRAADLQHPFGYGRVRYFWAFVVSVVLFSLGGLFALYEGVSKLRHPHELTSPAIAVGILALAVVLELFSFRTAVREANAVRGSQSWWSYVRHAKTAELPVVLLEDLAALVGLILALAGIGLVLITGSPIYDAASTIAIGGLLVVVAVVLAIEMKSLLIGESASAADIEAIRRSLEQSPGIMRLIHLKTVHLGPDELLVAGKIELSDDLSVGQGAEVINAAEDALRAAVPAARVVYLEPDVYRDLGGGTS